jgi:hypothetical protein
MPAPYRSTKKNVLALALALRYLGSAASRATDDEAMDTTHAAISRARYIIAEALTAERATRLEQVDGTPITNVVEVADAVPTELVMPESPADDGSIAVDLPSGEVSDAPEVGDAFESIADGAAL